MLKNGDPVIVNVGEKKSRRGVISGIDDDISMFRVRFDLADTDYLAHVDDIIPVVITSNTEELKEENCSGTKFDGNKPDLTLLPRTAKEGISRAFMDGERKYGRYNYLSGMDWTRLLAAADRHLSAFNDGEDCAEDSKLCHLYHAGANIMMLIEYYEKGLGNDNRFKEDK